MDYVRGVDRSKRCSYRVLRDYIPTNHPVRVLDAFVEGIDLVVCGFARTQPARRDARPTARMTCCACTCGLQQWGA